MWSWMARNCGRGLSCGQAKLSSKFVNLQSHQLTHHWRHTNSNTILKIISIYSTPSSRLLREVSQWKVLQVFGLCVTTRGMLVVTIPPTHTQVTWCTHISISPSSTCDKTSCIGLRAESKIIQRNRRTPSCDYFVHTYFHFTRFFISWIQSK